MTLYNIFDIILIRELQKPNNLQMKGAGKMANEIGLKMVEHTANNYNELPLSYKNFLSTTVVLTICGIGVVVAFRVKEVNIVNIFTIMC